MIHVHALLYSQTSVWKRLVAWDPTIQNIYNASANEIKKNLLISDGTAKRLVQWLNQSNPFEYVAMLKHHNIFPLSIEDSHYPTLLSHIYDPPILLYCKGNQHLLTMKKVAIVGSRTPSLYGKQVVKRLSTVFVETGSAIVSGLARGVDIEAHQSAIKAGGCTIAVTASGFFHPYPPEHQAFLTDTSPQSLLVVSEYPPHVKPKKWHFPTRNRIISGLSYATIIIEAKRKSGSLITADLALEQGREVFAVPGSIFSPESEGTNWLISQGAYCLYNEQTLFEYMPNFMSKSIERKRFS